MTEASSSLYAEMKALSTKLEFLDITEGYVKDEMANLKREMIRAKEEVKRIQSVPLVIGHQTHQIHFGNTIV